ncbi:MAG TPA: tetratricopeptide repeat protein [Spirochaetia bacterium]|nr:tetratricopeptide repeat protein [Spirochaetia bacterium]
MKGTKVGVLFVLLGFSVVGGLFASGVAEQIGAGGKAYSQERFAQAESDFKSALKREPASAAAAYDLGTAQYRQGNYPAALKSFRRAATADTASPSLQAKASYDQGKALAKLGDAAAARSPATAMSDYQKGVESFQRSLQINPSNPNAGFNIEALRRRIQRLEQRSKENPRPGNGKQGEPPRAAHSGTSVQPNASPRDSARGNTGATPAPTKNSPRAPKAQAPQSSASAGVASSKSGQSGAPGLTAQAILDSERNHPRIISIESQQVKPHVAQDW